MPHLRIRRPLAWAVVGTLLLPVVLSLVLGLAGLLTGLGDDAGAAICRGAALVVGVIWAAAIVAATTLNAVAILAAPPRRHKRRRRRQRARRPSREPPLGGIAGDRQP